MLDERLDLCYEALMCRHNALLGVTSDVSPVHWQYGAIARLNKGEKIDPLLYGGYSTMSLGYIGLYEVATVFYGPNWAHNPEAKQFTIDIIKDMKARVEEWSDQYDYHFSIYSTPSESLTDRFCRLDTEKFG